MNSLGRLVGGAALRRRGCGALHGLQRQRPSHGARRPRRERRGRRGPGRQPAIDPARLEVSPDRGQDDAGCGADGHSAGRSDIPTPTAGPPAATPTPPPPTATPLPTPTPTPGAATVIRLRAVRWAWQWIQGPGTTPGNPAPSITLKGGQTYQLRIFNGDIYDDAYLPHYFSGIFGYISGAPLAYGAPDVVLTFTAPSVTSTTVLGFSCQENGCGPVVRHEGMLGSIIVTP